MNSKILFLFLTLTAIASSLPSTTIPKEIFDETEIPTLPDTPKICNTEACQKIGFEIIDKMNLSVDPCDDFYEFACGSFSKNTNSEFDPFIQAKVEIKKKLRESIENNVTESDPQIFKTLQAYYNVCMNEDLMGNHNEKEFLDLLNVTLGGWPVLSGESWNESNFDWVKTIEKIYETGYIGNYIMKNDITVDLKNTSRYVIFADQATLGIPNEFLLEEGYYLQRYFKYMVDLAVILGANRNQSIRELNESLYFEVELAKISSPYSRKSDPAVWDNLLTLEELQFKYPIVPWDKYLKNVLKSELEPTDKIAVLSPNYLSNLSRVLDKTPKRVLANYLYWRVVKDSAKTLSKSIRETHRKFKEEIGGNNNEYMWQDCVDHVNNNLFLATGSLYAKRYFSEESKNNATELVVELKKIFQKLLYEVDWLINGTKVKALEKLDHMLHSVGYPDELVNNAILDDYYKDFKIQPNSFLKTTLNLNIFEKNKTSQDLRKPVMRNDWTLFSYATANAYYTPNFNAIRLPAGILQGIFFNEKHPKYINYGSIGSITGHEMTHGFDLKNREFDENGNFIDWWDQESEEKYLNKSQCIINQYSNYKSINTNVDGLKTAGENIADNGGVKLAYEAYEAWLTKNGEESRLPQLDFSSRKMFWISYASTWCDYYPTYFHLSHTHAPNKYRVIGSLSNSPEFSRDFNCPVGSKMNPIEKCSVW